MLILEIAIGIVVGLWLWQYSRIFAEGLFRAMVQGMRSLVFLLKSIICSRVVRVTVAVLFLAVSLGYVEDSLEASQHRANIASTWNHDTIQVTTSGVFNENLVTVLTPGSDSGRIPVPAEVRCDEFLQSVVSDASLVGKLRAEGFTSLSCGTHEEKF